MQDYYWHINNMAANAVCCTNTCTCLGIQWTSMQAFLVTHSYYNVCNFSLLICGFSTIFDTLAHPFCISSASRMISLTAEMKYTRPQLPGLTCSLSWLAFVRELFRLISRTGFCEFNGCEEIALKRLQPLGHAIRKGANDSEKPQERDIKTSWAVVCHMTIGVTQLDTVWAFIQRLSTELA